MMPYESPSDAKRGGGQWGPPSRGTTPGEEFFPYLETGYLIALRLWAGDPKAAGSALESALKAAMAEQAASGGTTSTPKMTLLRCIRTTWRMEMAAGRTGLRESRAGSSANTPPGV